MKSPLEILQPLGRALMLPIAVLPIAGLLLRLGQPDLLSIPFVAAAGDAIFAHLGLLFAVGVAVGLARENNGAAGLAGLVGFLIATEGAKVLLHAPTEIAGELAVAAFKAKAVAKLAVPIGILSGVLAGLFYNRFSTIRLPEYLAFFGGRRFVPIVSGFAGLGVALVVGLGYDAVNGGMDALSRAIVGSGEVGLFVYGALNRLLIVTGLHHILNNIAWFIVGDFNGVTGDIKRFFAGDPTAGAFQAGFFPVMMFGLPAACLAMYHAARPERRKAVGGMLFSMALTAFLTGVTEPIEFSFMFLAPALYAIHALLTGAGMALMDMLGVRLGFGFSAGLFDYVLNFGKATRPLMLLSVGAAYAVVYYVTFRWAIARFDLKTPGREPQPENPDGLSATSLGGRGADFVAALGGTGNLVSVDACTTRLRLIVNSQKVVDEGRLKALGARGVVRPSDRALQVVLGPLADAVASEIRAAGGGLAKPDAPAVQAAQNSVKTIDGAPWLQAFGGADNIRELSVCSSRLRLKVVDDGLVDEAALRRLGARGLARPAGTLHVVIGPSAETVAAALRA